MEVNGTLMAARTKFADDPLRLAQSVSADQHAAARVRVQAVEQAVDLAACVRVAEHRQAERRLGDEDVAGHRHEGWASRVRPALVVAGYDDAFSLVLHDDL